MTSFSLALITFRVSAALVLLCVFSWPTLAQRPIKSSCNALRARNAPKPRTFFPKDKLSPDEIEWYSEYLFVMKEPSLLPRDNCAVETYRFLWLRTFHAPIAIRVWTLNGRHFLVAKQLSGQGGYDTGRMVINRIKTLSNTEWEQLKNLLSELTFWDLPTEDTNRGGRDGAQWILEGLQDGKYHLTDRWSAEAKYREVCLYFLKLSNLRVRQDDIY